MDSKECGICKKVLVNHQPEPQRWDFNNPYPLSVKGEVCWDCDNSYELTARYRMEFPNLDHEDIMMMVLKVQYTNQYIGGVHDGK